MAQFNKPNTVNQVWASAGIISAPENLKITQGWSVEIPPYQYFNWSQNRIDSFIAHINQMGISTWDQVTEYQAGKSYVQGSDGVIYKAKTTNTNVDPANPLNSAAWERAFEQFGSVAIVDNKVNTLQTSYNTLANVANYPQARQNLGVWSRVESDARYAYKSGEATQVFSVANATQNSHAIPLGQLNSLLQQSTTTIVGISRLATAIEVEQGTLDNVIVTPVTGNVYVKKSQNLADIPNKATARTNLGLTDAATTSLNDFLLKSGNLTGLANVSTARTNLGLGTMAVENTLDWLPKNGNLSGLTNVSSARTNLGLGNSATRDVGTSINTVAAGDDARIVNAVQNTRNIVAGNGLTGGGTLSADRAINLGTPSNISISSTNSVSGTSHTHNLDVNSFIGTSAGTFAAGDDSRIVNATPNTRNIVAGNGLTGGGTLTSDRTFNLGTPSTITASSGNSVSSTSHTHAFDITSFFADRNLATEGYYVLPGGFVIQWGVVNVGGGSGGAPVGMTVNLNKTLMSSLFGIQLTYRNATDNDGDSCHARSNGTLDSFYLANQGRPNSIFWVAYGV